MALGRSHFCLKPTCWLPSASLWRVALFISLECSAIPPLITTTAYFNTWWIWSRSPKAMPVINSKHGNVTKQAPYWPALSAALLGPMISRKETLWSKGWYFTCHLPSLKATLMLDTQNTSYMLHPSMVHLPKGTLLNTLCVASKYGILQWHVCFVETAHLNLC